MAGVLSSLGLPQSVTGLSPGASATGCRLPGFEVEAGRGMELRVRSVTWERMTPEDGSSEVAVPLRLRASLRGVRAVPDPGDSAAEAVARAFRTDSAGDITLTLRWDDAGERVVIAASGGGLGRSGSVLADAEIRGLSLGALAPAIASLGVARVEGLTARLRIDGRLERHVLALLALSRMPPGGGEAELADITDRAARAVGDWPDAVFPAEARDALRAALEDIPPGQGALEIAVEAAEPWSPAGLAAALARGGPVPSGLRLNLRYER